MCKYFDIIHIFIYLNLINIIMANIILDYTTAGPSRLVSETHTKLIENGHEVYLLAASNDITLDKEGFELILQADAIIFFVLVEDLSDEYVDWVKIVVNTAMNDEKNRFFFTVGFENTVTKIAEFIPTDGELIINHDWGKNVFLEVMNISVLVNETLSGITSATIGETKIKKEIKHNIESNAPEFINSAISRLGQRGKTLNKIANRYFIGGCIAIILGITAGVYFFVHDRDYFGQNENWSITVFFALKSIIIISLMVALAKYAFILGKAYMHESLKIEDRIHAISFGQFYLNVYKAGVDQEDLKDVFRDWNIAGQATAFSSQDPKAFDPQYLENLSKIIEKSKDIVKAISSSPKSHES